MFTDPVLITMISLGVTVLFMLGVPVFLVIGFWVIGCTIILPEILYMNNIGTALSDIFTDGFALLAMPLPRSAAGVRITFAPSARMIFLRSIEKVSTITATNG